MFKYMLMKQVDLHYNCEQKKVLGGYFQISHICSSFFNIHCYILFPEI